MQGMNVKGIVSGVVMIVAFLIVFGIVVTQADTLWTAIQATNHSFTGLVSFVSLIPLLVLLGGMGFGGWTVVQGIRGQGGDANLKGMVGGIIVIFVFLVLFELVVTQTDSIWDAVQATVHTFTGLTNFLALIPLLVLLGGMGFGGWVVFQSARGKQFTTSKGHRRLAKSGAR
jgi:hypothetical protein